MEDIQIFIDRACRYNGQANAKASYGVFCDHESLKIREGKRLSVKEPQTNGRSELRAVVEALKILDSKKLNKGTIKTDSTYVANSANRYVHNWQKNSWKLKDGGPAKHRDLWENFLELSIKGEFKVKHIKRDSEEGNKIADKLANEALDEDKIADNTDEVVENDEILLSGVIFRSIDKAIFENELKCPVCRKNGTDNLIECSKCRKYIYNMCAQDCLLINYYQSIGLKGT